MFSLRQKCSIEMKIEYKQGETNFDKDTKAISNDKAEKNVLSEKKMNQNENWPSPWNELWSRLAQKRSQMTKGKNVIRVKNLFLRGKISFRMKICFIRRTTFDQGENWFIRVKNYQSGWNFVLSGGKIFNQGEKFVYQGEIFFIRVKNMFEKGKICNQGEKFDYRGEIVYRRWKFCFL